jgi:hypothetical protein
VLQTSGTDCASSQDRNAARVYFSKPGQPEAVPYGFYFSAGSDDWPIVRIIALRDSVFCFKQNGEIWRISGEDTGSFSIRIHDQSTSIYGARTAAVFNNEIYMFSDQGVVSVSDAGVGIKSFTIENDLNRYLSPVLYPTFETTSVGVAYGSDRSYLLFAPDRVWRYNSVTGAWSTWSIVASAAYHNDDSDVLEYAADDFKVWNERKDFTILDYSDDRFTLDLTVLSGLDVTFTDASELSVGDGIYQNAETYAVITGIAGNVVTIDRIVGFTVGVAYGCRPILCSMRWSPITAGNPGMMKRYTGLTAFFRDMSDEFTTYCTTNFDESETVPIVVDPTFSGSGWGESPWGDFPWGGENSGSQQSRVGWPVRSCRALWGRVRIETERPFTRFSLLGVSVLWEPVSSRFER